MKRIVSLVPSLTESICALGLKDELVACTAFCVEPKGLHHSVALVGGTKDPNIEAIKELSPTHILLNTEENRAADIEALKDVAPCLVTFPKSPLDVFGLWEELGRFLGLQEVAAAKVNELQKCFESLQTAKQEKPDSGSKKVAYLIWRNPYMVAAKDTYIDECLRLAGFVNAFEDANEGLRYPEVTVKEFAEREVECILLSSEPFAFRKRHAQEIRDQQSTSVEICKVDGKLFSWYGETTTELIKKLTMYFCNPEGSKLFMPM